MSLSRSSLPIGEDGTIVAVHDILDDAEGGAVVKVLLVGAGLRKSSSFSNHTINLVQTSYISIVTKIADYSLPIVHRVERERLSRLGHVQLGVAHRDLPALQVHIDDLLPPLLDLLLGQRPAADDDANAFGVGPVHHGERESV